MDKLKALVSSLDGINEAFHDLYEKTAEGYVLSGVEDKDYKQRLDEFRNNNVSYRKKIEDLEEKAESYKDVDPELYAKMKVELADITDKKLIDEGKVDELLEQRTERMRKEYTDKFDKINVARQAAEDSVAKLTQKLNTSTLNELVTETLAKKAVLQQGALADVLTRASASWKADSEGNFTAYNRGGEVLYGSDGKAPITMEEWTETLVKEAPFLFEGSRGGESPGSSQVRPGASFINLNDREGFSNNLEGIASGKVDVR